MTKDDTAVFHAFAWNTVKAEYDDWRGMGTRAAIAARSLEAQGPVHYCPLPKVRRRKIGDLVVVTSSNTRARAVRRFHTIGTYRRVRGMRRGLNSRGW
jgi:hypothetical protein